MKKIIYSALCLLVLAAGSVSAQQRRYYPRDRPGQRRNDRRQPPVDQIKFGLVGGVNVSNIVNVNDPNFTTGTLAGLNLGVTLEAPITHQVWFNPELLYSGKGYSA